MRCVGGAVADTHVVRLSEPDHHVSVDLACGSRIQQVVNIDLAYISGATVAVGLAPEAAAGAGVVCALSRKSCGWFYV